jgi:GntR family transcriptional regulator, carbon starvation induced regulator
MTLDSSLTNRAYVQLREELISCLLEPGSRLNISRLQKKLGVSQAAVREALSRLTSEGLAIIERNSGFRAAPVSVTGYRELAKACAVLEEPCLRWAIAKGDLAWEGALLSTFHVASRVLEKVVAGKAEIGEYARHREEFHRKLFSACENQWLLWSWSLLYAQHVRFRQTFPDLAKFEMSLGDDFRQFLDATMRRDANEAVRLWCENHDKVSTFIESHLNASGRRAA